MFFPSTLSERVANSTPIVDFDSRLNSFLVNRASTGSYYKQRCGKDSVRKIDCGIRTVTARPDERSVNKDKQVEQVGTYDFPTPESPIRTTYNSTYPLFSLSP